MKKIILVTTVTSLIVNLFLIMIGGFFMEESYGFCNSKCKHPVYTKEDINGLFTELTGTITVNNNSTSSINLDYPDGFDQSNTWVISQMMLMIPNGTNNMTSGFAPAFATNPRVTLMSDYIELYCSFSSTMSNATFKYKVLLMKSLNS